MADEILIKIDADGRQAEAEMRRTGRAIQGLGKDAQASGRAAKMMGAAWGEQQRTLQQLGGAAKTATVGLSGLAVAGLTSVVRAGAAYEQQMARVQAVTGANAKQFGQLNAQAKKLGAETKFSAGQAAAAMYELSAAGFTVAQTQKSLPGVLSLAAASGIELKDAAEISANALRGFGLEASKSGHVADVMAEAVNRSSLEMVDLQYSMKYIGPIAKTTGQSLESMTAAISLMGNAGIKGEQAGTTLRGALVRLTAPTKAVEEGLGQLGLKAADLQGPKGLKPLPEIIRIIERNTRGMDQATRNAALANVFGTEALSGMVAVIDQGSGKLVELTRAYRESDGSAKKAADTMNNTVAGAFDGLKGSIETVQISLFEQFRVPLRESLKEAAQLVSREGKELEEFFERVTGTREFRQGDLGTKLSVVWEEATKEIDTDALADNISGAVNDAVSAAAPEAAKAFGAMAITAAGAFAEGFAEADPITKLLLGGYAAKKLGLFAAFGARAGQATAAGMATGAAGGAAAAGGGKGGGIKGAAKTGAGLAGIALAVQMAAPRGDQFDGLDVSGYSGGLKGIGERVGSLGGLNPFVGGPDDRIKKTKSLLADFRAEMTRLAETGNGPGLKQLATQLDALGQAGGNVDSDALSSYADRIDRLGDRVKAFQALSAKGITVDLNSDLTRQGAEDIARALEQLKRRSTGSVEDIKTAVRMNMRLIQRSMRDGSAESKEALSRNFSIAADKVKEAMEAGAVSTKEGTDLINTYLRKGLALFGITGKQATRYLNGQDTLTGKSDTAAGNPGRGAARGMLNRLPGGVGPDSIPMQVNGRSIVAAPGEDVAIINRHQRAVLDARLSDMGGLGGLFKRVSTPHHHGGPGFARGGMVTGDTDFSPALGSRLEAMARSTGRPIFVQSGRRSIAEQAALYARYKGKRPVAAPNPNAPHVRGVAADITPGREVFGGVAARHGLGFTVPSEAWHIELAGAVAAGAISAGQAEKIKRAMWNGPGGALGAMGQAGLDRYRDAAQSILDGAAGSMGQGDGETTGGGKTSAGGQYSKSMLKALWVRAGGDPSVANLMAAIALAESAGNPSVVNSIGATGLWQIHPGGSQYLDPLTNAKTAVMKYKTQGLKAWEAYTRGMHTQFLASGGMVATAAKTDSKTRAKLPRKPKKKGKKGVGGLWGTRKGLGRGIKLTADWPSDLLAQIGTLEDERIPLLGRALAGTVRQHDRTDEGAMLGDLENLAQDGKLTQEEVNGKFSGIVAAHVAELTEQARQQAGIVGAYQTLESQVNQAVTEIKTVIEARRRRYHDLMTEVRENTREIRQVQGEYTTEAKKKGKARDPKKLKRLAARLDRLRDRRQVLVGQRELQTGPLDQVTQGTLGNAHASLSSALGRLPEFESKAKFAPFETADARADLQDIADQIGEWTGKASPKLEAAATDSDQAGREADFYRKQATNALAAKDIANAQFGVFKGFEGLAGMRFLGAFAQGVTNVDRTGLAILHQGETVTPAVDGGFRDRTTMTAPAGPTEVYVTIEGDMAGLIRVVDARVGQRGSQNTGQRARLLSVAPGGR